MAANGRYALPSPWGVLLCLLALVAFPGPALAGSVVKIALAAPLTGPLASGGDDIKAGAVMKVEQINAAGGIGGKPVEIVFLDDLCEPREAAVVARSVVNDPDIVGVVGHICSSAHLAALPLYVAEGVPVVTPTATSVVISFRNRDEDGRIWGFRTVYRDDFQGKFLAKYIARAMGLTKVGLLYENSDYGIGFRKAFLKQAARKGLRVVAVEAYKKGDLDFAPQLTKLRGAGLEGLCIAGSYAEAALIAGQARTVGLDVPKFGADALDNPDYIRLAGEAAAGTYLSAPWQDSRPDSPGRRFDETFAARYHRQPSWMSAYAYDTVGLLLAAVAQAGPDREAVRAALAARRSPETAYAGITGAIFFDAAGDCQRPGFVKTVRDGRFVEAQRQLP